MRRIALFVACLLGSGCASGAPAVVATSLPPVAGEMHSQGGVRYISTADGRGTQVARGRCVYAHYAGFLADGTPLESSRAPADGSAASPVAFIQGTGKVMPGWEAGFEGMRAGATRRLFIPYRLGYGANGNPPRVPPRADLVFDVEVIAVQDAENSRCPPLRY